MDVRSWLMWLVLHVGYVNNVISAVVTILDQKYGSDAITAHDFGTVLRSVAFVGILCGQLSFGVSLIFLLLRFGEELMV